MKKLVTLAFIAVLPLAACSTGNGPESEPAETSTSMQVPTSTTSPEANSATPSALASESPMALGPVQPQAESERGNLIKQVGEMAGISDENGDPIIDFTVDRMTVDPKCTGRWKEKAENGHLILLEVTAQTYKNVDDVNSNGWDLNPYGFKIIKTDGTTSNAPAGSNAAYSCFSENKYLPTMGDAEKASGYVVLDVEDPSGTLVYEEGYTGIGWEWDYPAS